MFVFNRGIRLIKRRIIIALLSTIVSSFILAIYAYTPMADRIENAWYESFFAPVPIFLIFNGFAYIVFAIPVSFIIDKYVHNELLKLPIYLIAGFIAGMLTIFIFFLTYTTELFSFGLYGVFGSIIYFLMMWLSKIFYPNIANHKRISS